MQSGFGLGATPRHKVDNGLHIAGHQSAVAADHVDHLVDHLAKQFHLDLFTPQGYLVAADGNHGVETGFQNGKIGVVVAQKGQLVDADKSYRLFGCAHS